MRESRHRVSQRHVAHIPGAILGAIVPLAGAAGCGPSFEATSTSDAEPRVTSAWPEYGGGMGQRYVSAGEISRGNTR